MTTGLRMARRIALWYVGMLLAFTLAIVGVFSIPTSAIRSNVAESANQIEADGLWFQPLGFYLFQVDNMTDCLMMNIAATADSHHPGQSAMWANVGRYDYDELRGNYLNMPQMTHDVAEYGVEHMDTELEYARYWHGYQVFLRPLLTVMTYHGILVLNATLLFLLLALTLYLAYRRFSQKEFWSFVACLLVVFVPSVPLAIQFSICFHIAFVGMCIVLKDERINWSYESVCTLFFVLGGATSFFDFLTTPQITLGLPLIALILNSSEVRRKKKLVGDYEIQLGDYGRLVGVCALWAVGYASIWAGKWVVASLITHENIIEGALGAAQVRVSDSIVFGGVEMPMSTFFGLIWQKLCGVLGVASIYTLIALLFLGIVLLCIKAYRHRHVLKPYAWLLLVALIVPAWYVVMKNHTLQHIFFTWRAIVVTLWSVALLLIYIREEKR